MTHRDSVFRDTFDSIVLARGWLTSKSSTVKQFHNRAKFKEGKSGNKHKDKLISLRAARKHMPQRMNNEYKDKATAGDIQSWLKPNLLLP